MLKIKTPLMFYLKKVVCVEDGYISQPGGRSDLPEMALRAKGVSECVQGIVLMFLISVKSVVSDLSVGTPVRVYRGVNNIYTCLSVQNICLNIFFSTLEMSVDNHY
jgi:hypothetical protein